MASKILKGNGQVIVLSTYRGLSDDELTNPDEGKLRDQFNQTIQQKLGGGITDSNITQVDPEAKTPYHDRYGDDIEGTYNPTPDIDDATPEYQDTYIGADVTILLQGSATSGIVTKRARTVSGDLYGKANNNPILDTRAYEVEFP
jgi:hypothetical protein